VEGIHFDSEGYILGAQHSPTNPNFSSAYFFCVVKQYASTFSNGARLSVTMSSVDDLVGADEDDEGDDVIVSVDELGALDTPSDETLEPSAPFLHAEAITAARAKYRLHDNDSGSPEFQVAGMTERISYLTGHLKANPKDFSTRRGLVALVNKRRRLLNYLFKEDENRYAALVSSLGIRHKAPSKFQSRDEAYGNFPPQKALKKHLMKKGR